MGGRREPACTFTGGVNMKDNSYALPLLPISMAALTVDGANAIEENLKYLLSLFSLFDAQIQSETIGSLGYLELTETGNAGEGFFIENAVQIDVLTVVVAGEDLSALSWAGEGWAAETSSATEIRLVFESPEYLDAAGAQQALASLLFSATAGLDATLTLIASCKTEMTFDALGPVILRFREGATWALIESQGWTWDGFETAGMTWTDVQNLRK